MNSFNAEQIEAHAEMFKDALRRAGKAGNGVVTPKLYREALVACCNEIGTELTQEVYDFAVYFAVMQREAYLAKKARKGDA